MNGGNRLQTYDLSFCLFLEQLLTRKYELEAGIKKIISIKIICLNVSLSFLMATAAVLVRFAHRDRCQS